jgi:GNAT superfamily N-acetyltransferase
MVPSSQSADRPHDLADAVRLAEGAEAEFMLAMASGAPPDAQAQLGMVQERIGGGVVLAMAGDPTGGYWNKALGFGVTEPVTADLVEEVLGVYRRAGSGVAVLQVAPSVLPDDWGEICDRHGIAAGQAWVKLLRPTALEPADASSTLRVEPLEPRDAGAWAHAYCVGFGMPEVPALVAMMEAGTDAAAGFHPFAAWDGDTLVAAANLHVSGPAGAFCGAATLPEARGRGAQSMFMRVRLEAARALGLEWVSAETWQEGEGQHNPSLHNMLRAGFVEVYPRTNWVWRAP